MKKILAALALLPITCFAMSGQELHSLLSSSNSADKREAFRYIEGILDLQIAEKGAEANAAAKLNRPADYSRFICADKSAREQAPSMVRDFLEKNPAARSDNPAAIVYMVLHKATACK